MLIQMEQAYVLHDLQKPECHYQRDSAEGCSGIRIVVATGRAGKHLKISAEIQDFLANASGSTGQQLLSNLFQPPKHDQAVADLT